MDTSRTLSVREMSLAEIPLVEHTISRSFVREIVKIRNIAKETFFTITATTTGSSKLGQEDTDLCYVTGGVCV